MNKVSNVELDRFRKKAESIYKNKVSFSTRADYYTARKNCQLDDHMILYECFNGRGITCNPGALFRYLHNDPRFAEFTHVVVLEESDDHDRVASEFADDPRVRFIGIHNQEYYTYLSTAKYLITNVTWPSYFAKKEGQIIINTWHGIPLKNLGYDVPDGSLYAGNQIRNFLMTDYLISPVPFTTENFKTAFKLDGIFPGKIIETGYPRIDRTVYVERAQIQNDLQKSGVNYDPHKKLILWAPTWRGAKYATPDINPAEYLDFAKTIYKYIDKEKYQVLFKPHQVVYKALRENGLLEDTFIPATVDTNALLGITDILISDYSSIFFDFLVTDRPILFYIPDLDTYTEERGLYTPVDTLPGPISNDPEQIGQWCGRIENYKTFFDPEKYTAAKEKFVCNDDGHVCERVVDTIFFGDTSHCITLENKKKKLLFHTDGIMPNGISFSMQNLLNNIDCDKYDVSFYAIGSTGNTQNYLAGIPDGVRVLYKTAPVIISCEDYARREYCLEHAIVESDGDPLFPAEFYDTEFHRAFGDAQFDCIINFSGFSAMWANLYVSQKKPRQVIWMHNVMQSEYDRCVNGKYTFRRNLDNIYKLYPQIDKYVSCSHAVMEVNRADLSTPATYSRFGYAKNLTNSTRVLQGAADHNIVEIDGKKYLLFVGANQRNHALVPAPEKGQICFATMGRLAEAKNHARLIDAFAKLCKERDDLRLYIIGDGPLRNKLRSQITKLGLTGKVILTGNISNPFALLADCDCFVLPSFYEGQPMVLLEARTLHLPIIVSNFASVKDSLYPDGQLCIEMETQDIYNGLTAFLDGNVPNAYPFDPNKYNQEAMAEFEVCLED